MNKYTKAVITIEITHDALAPLYEDKLVALEDSLAKTMVGEGYERNKGWRMFRISTKGQDNL